jgi:hypothetical protein
MSRVLSLLLVIAIVAGCQHAQPPPPRIEGSSSYTFVEPPPPPAPAKAPVQVGPEAQLPVETLLLAAPIEPLAKPVYPASVLGREKMPVVVGIRIIVDPAGRITDARTSLAVLSTPTPFMEEFRAAVDQALTQWRFRPGELRRLAPTTDANGAPAWILAHREKTDCVFDVSFIFQSTGEVVSQGLK